DLTQIDLPPTQVSGLVQALDILHDIPGLSIVRMTKKDIVRHKLVSRIVDAYDRYDQEHKPRQKKETNKDKENEQGTN
ncbi:MAG: PhoH family protein, partial [Bacteroidaceae bacterium]|nr:PhoH family protein [Bacteroidaceae bacterium]